jgi:hypothetical protein
MLQALKFLGLRKRVGQKAVVGQPSDFAQGFGRIDHRAVAAGKDDAIVKAPVSVRDHEVLDVTGGSVFALPHRPVADPNGLSKCFKLGGKIFIRSVTITPVQIDLAKSFTLFLRK